MNLNLAYLATTVTEQAKKQRETEERLRENLVVCMLFFNKLEQTIESAESFLEAGVKLHLLNNGSTEQALDALRRYFEGSNLVSIFDAGGNRGVSGGRNIQINKTSEQWLFFVDNDISIHSENWLSVLAKEMNACPVAEIFVPRLFNKHENTWGFASDFVVDGSGNCSFIQTDSAFSNSFPGGASIVSRDVFGRLGGYDEDLFVGFEDFEIAIRAWRHGQPLLVKRIEDFYLIHDHRISTTAADKATALVRYDVGHISHSHAVVRDKHGVLLDPSFEAWLREQVHQLTGESVISAPELALTKIKHHTLRGNILCPRFCGQGQIRVAVDGATNDLWFRLRAVNIARSRAESAGLTVRIELVGGKIEMARNALTERLVDAIYDVDEWLLNYTAQGLALDGIFCWQGAGLISSEFFIQVAQSVHLNAAEADSVHHPARIILASEDGTGMQIERIGEFDPFVVRHDPTQFPTFAVRGLAVPSLPIIVGHVFSRTMLAWLACLTAKGFASIAVPGSVVILATESQALVDNLENMVSGRKIVESTTGYAAWLRLEQENLQPITLNQNLAASDWNRFPIHRQTSTSVIVLESYDHVVRLREFRIRNVIILPWFKHGGADKAAISYLQVLAGKVPGRILAITTEAGNSPWMDQIPDGVEVLEWSKVFHWESLDQSAYNLSWVLSRLCPSVVHIMNSSLGWEVLARDGVRLRAVCHTFASLFWYGPSDRNRLWGYASEYLPRIMANDSLDAVITDNSTFPSRLHHDYGVPLKRFQCVRHPTSQIATGPKTRLRGNSPPTILWASRFAPEKRMDLLAKIASNRPLYRFLVYGVADGCVVGVDENIDCLKELENVDLCGSYDGFDTLPTNECDLFLYTSSSDGMPNVVIEAAAHGLPIIASIVGGVGELIETATGWPVNSIDDIDAYLLALDQAVSCPNEAILKAARALERVQERHSFESFARQLREVPGYLP